MSEIEVFDAEQLAGLIEGLAEAIGRDHPHLQKLTLIGIRTRGVPLAYRLRDRIATLLGIPPQVGELDITFFPRRFERWRVAHPQSQRNAA